MKSLWAAALCVAMVGCGNDDTGTVRSDRPSGPAGPGGDSTGTGGTAAKCEQFKSVAIKCYDDYCAAPGAAPPFCNCWNAGQDLSLQTCGCIARNLEPLCTAINLDNVDLSRYSCSAATSAVSHVCN